MFKKRSKMKTYQKINLFALFCATILISSMSLGYSILSSELSINTNATVRVQKNIRITEISNPTATNGGFEVYNGKYTENSTTFFVDLDELNSTISYNVTITNSGSTNMKVSKINIDVFNNDSMKYTFSNLAIGTVIPIGESLTYTITFSYDGLTTLPQNRQLGFSSSLTFAETTGGTSSLYVGESVAYLSKNWHIIATDSSTTTLFADNGEFSAMAHCLHGTTSTTYCYWVSNSSMQQYQWSKSQVNYYLNNTWLNTVNSSSLSTFNICNDTYTGNGGSLDTEGLTCTNGYISSFVRLLTKIEYSSLKGSLSDTSWLYSSTIGNYMLLNTGTRTFSIDYIDSNGNINYYSSNGNLNADHSVAVRPVIKVNTNTLKTSLSKITSIDITSSLSKTNANGLTYINLGIGKTDQLTGVTTPNSSVTFNWSSSDTSVATIDSNGLITGLKTGSTVITCSYGTVTSTINVYVMPVYSSTTTYAVGDYVLYKREAFNVVSDNGTYLKLIGAPYIIGSLNHCYNVVDSTYCYWASSSSYVNYQWSKSYVNNYLNNIWLPTTAIAPADLSASQICDANFTGTGAGMLSSETTCSASNVSSYVRLLSLAEYNSIKNSTNVSTWLYSSDIGTWSLSNAGNGVMFAYSVGPTGNTFYSGNGTYNADHKVLVRPVIVVIK